MGKWSNWLEHAEYPGQNEHGESQVDNGNPGENGGHEVEVKKEFELIKRKSRYHIDICWKRENREFAMKSWAQKMPDMKLK